MYQGALPPLEVLEQSHEFANLQEINWQRASSKMATCTVRVEGHRTGPRALLHALRQYTLRAK